MVVADKGRIGAGHRGISAMPANRLAGRGWLLSERVVVPGVISEDLSMSMNSRRAQPWVMIASSSPTGTWIEELRSRWMTPACPPAVQATSQCEVAATV